MYYKKYIKRLLDFSVAALLLIVLSPLLLFLTVLIALKMGRPVLFTQIRPGQNEKLFHIYKFRTMTDARDKNNNPLPDEERLTVLGRFLRKSSLDELPELLNVLTGTMSLVGPRPLLPEYSSSYTDLEKKRFTVLPGITGLAQINGRTYLNWDRRLEKDVEYVQNLSFKLDILIMIKTLFYVIHCTDSAENADEVEPRLDDYRKSSKKSPSQSEAF